MTDQALATIPLTRGFVATVDTVDYPTLVQHRWIATTNHPSRTHNITYAGRYIRLPDGRKRYLYMHRVIMGVESAVQVDHRDGDGLNNRRDNLRLASRVQNQRARHHAHGQSCYKGVDWSKYHTAWRARIRHQNRRETFLGYFSDEVMAARAYDSAARLYFGAFAVTNFADIPGE